MQVLELPLFADTLLISKSPRGTFVIDPGQVAPGDDQALGDLARFTVELDPVTYLGLESVDKVEIRWQKDDGQGGTTLESGRPACHFIEASAGQTTLECETDFLQEHEGEQTFYALVHAKLFGLSLPVSLDVGPDAKAVLDVGEPVVVTVDPTVVTLAAGQSQPFTAMVTGADDPGVNWTATGGSISGSGLYTAGGAAGTYKVRATSREDADAWDEATVNVVLPQIEGEFHGAYTDQSTCSQPGPGSSPLIIWLYEHDPFTDEIKVAIVFGHEGTAGDPDRRFEGTISGGSILAYLRTRTSLDPDDYFEGTLSGASLTGRWYESCGDGTHDIWGFQTTRVN